ncbi:MAG: hypothetical protein GIW95_10075 [Candidatus Eremiobacteraeota bacterium]|nr:hypothetical protein [Candidatus Eremiobacteraeota bacterium]
MNATADRQFAEFLSKYDPAMVRLTRAVLKKLRALLPGAVEMVYDNYNALVVGFSPTERVSDALLSIGIYPRWLNLYFLEGAALPDPYRVLEGSGKQVRRIMLERAATLDEPAIRATIALALDRAEKPFDSSKPRRMVVKSVSAKQRSRRPAGAR